MGTHDKAGTWFLILGALVVVAGAWIGFGLWLALVAFGAGLVFVGIVLLGD